MIDLAFNQNDVLTCNNSITVLTLSGLSTEVLLSDSFKPNPFNILIAESGTVGQCINKSLS